MVFGGSAKVFGRSALPGDFVSVKPIDRAGFLDTILFDMPDSFVITSRQNPLIQDLRDRSDPAVAKGLFLEGLHLLEEALKAKMTIHHLLVVPALAETELVRQAMGKAKRTTQISSYVMKALSDVESPQGVITICSKPAWDWASLISKSPALVVILDVLQDPGNAASILRTAEA